MVRLLLIPRGTAGSVSQKRVSRGTPRVGRVHKTRCFVNTDHTHTVALMGLSPKKVRVAFDMTMVGHGGSTSGLGPSTSQCT